MTACVHHFFVSIVLLCILTEIHSGRFPLPSFRTKKSRDYGAVVERVKSFRSDSFGLPSVQVFQPTAAELTQIRQVLQYDPNANDFVRNESPSITKQIINLSQTAGTVEGVIKTAVAAEAKNAVVTSYVPMSEMVVERTFKLNEDQIADLERLTRDDMNRLNAEKRIRLTADLFGSICLGDTTEALAVWASSPRYSPDAPREKMVLKALQEELKKPIWPSGLFVDRNRGYLAAVPDALVLDKSLIKLHVVQRAGKGRVGYRWNRSDFLSSDKPLYYEVQGLLNITGRQQCYLVIVARDDIKSFTVERNKDFWENKMLGKLDDFYLNHLLPRLSNEKLPKLTDIRKAASMLYASTLDFTREQVKRVMEITEDEESAYETMMQESKVRLLSRHFHIVMNNEIPMKAKVQVILDNYYRNKAEWQFERELKMQYVKSYAKKNNLNVEIDGLIIDRTNRFLAAMPSALGRNRPGYYYRKDRKKKGLKDPDTIFEVVTPTFWFKGTKAKKPAKYILGDLNYMERIGEGKDSKWALKKNSKYYYKVQGSLAITRVKTCIFMVAVPGRRDSFVEKIEFNQDFWSDMLDKLKHFYFSTWLIFHASPSDFNKMFEGPDVNWPQPPALADEPSAPVQRSMTRPASKRFSEHLTD